MKPRIGQEGYALLAALVVTALAALVAAAAAAAAGGAHQVAAADRAAVRASAAAWQALDDEAERLRWQPWLAQPPLAADGWRSASVAVQGAALDSRSQLSAVLELRLPQWCGGLVCGGDLQVQAPLTVAGSGACAGGRVLGRQWVAFAGGADLVHGDLWAAPAVHAVDGIWAAGQEIHGDVAAGVAPASWAADTDVHTAQTGLDAVVAAPDAALLAALRDGAVAPGAALGDGVLDVSRLPAAPPGASGAAPDILAAGFVVFVPAADGPVRLTGERAPDACPLVLVVDGDATAGDATAVLALRGAVLVRGHLDVAGVTAVEGSLCTGSLTVSAPLTVTTAPDWRAHPAAGLATPAIAQLKSS